MTILVGSWPFDTHGPVEASFGSVVVTVAVVVAVSTGFQNVSVTFNVGVKTTPAFCVDTEPVTPPTKDGLQWIDENQDGLVQTTELQVVPGSPGLPSEGFDRRALGADLQVHWCLCELGTGMAFAEVVAATNLDRGLIYADPVASARDLRELGFTVGVVQNVTPYARVGVRYDRYDGDRDAFQRAGLELVGVDQVYSTLSVMAMGVWHEARFVVQYDRGRNPFGIGDDGTPTTRDADRLTLRAQVGF